MNPTTSSPGVRALVRAERQDLLATLTGLTNEQWASPSLCDGWTVRDVVAHVIGNDELTTGHLVGRFVRGALVPARINAIGVAVGRYRSPEDLMAGLSTHLAPHGVSAALGGRLGLVDVVVHHQDIRRPLGLAHQIPAERLIPAISTALYSPVLLGVRRARGLRLVAEDVDRSWGRGPEVRGTGEALLMAVAGRRASIDELRGPGRDRLARRLSA